MLVESSLEDKALDVGMLKRVATRVERIEIEERRANILT